MLKRLLACSLLVAAACQRAPEDANSLGASSGTASVASVPVRPVPAIDVTDPGVDPRPESMPTPGEVVSELSDPVPEGDEGAFSSEFMALPPAYRSAVKAFFERGPGAVRGGGTVDSVVGMTSGGQTGAANGNAGARIALRGAAVPGYPGCFNFTLSNTGSGIVEKFLLQVPDVPPVGPVPLLVVFHKFGVSHADVLYHTTFITEVRNRGWYLLAPVGATGQNYGSLTSQINVRAVLNYALGQFSIDKTRIYGVGFSMGAGGIATYAARHLVPTEAMFAAIVNHTGSVSLTHTYANEGPTNRSTLEGLFGGPPSTSLFEYQRCSTIDLDPSTNVIGAGTDMARNLRHVPIRTWHANNDPLSYLLTQTLAFSGHVQGQNAGNVLTTVQDTIHDWSTLDETLVCDWLAQFTLQHPTSGTTLADQDGVYHRFQVEQDAGGAFTPFSWTVDAQQNRVTISNSSNLRRLSIDSAGLGLAYAGSFRLDVSAIDGTGDQVVLLGVPFAPSAAFRNGMASSGQYDAIAHSYAIDEAPGTGGQWVIVF